MALTEFEISDLKSKAAQISPPRYITVSPEGIHKQGQYIGMDAFSALGEAKTFLWYTNFSRRTGPMVKRDPFKYASYVVRLKLHLGIDAAIGPAYDIKKSSSRTDTVVLIDYTQAVGVYVDIAERFGEALQSRYGMPTMQELVKKHPEADDLYSKALILSPLDVSHPKNENKGNSKRKPFSPAETEEMKAFSRFHLRRFVDGLPKKLDEDVDLEHIRASFGVIRGLIYLYNASSRHPLPHPDDLLKDLSYRKLKDMAILTLARFNQNPGAADLASLLDTK